MPDRWRIFSTKLRRSSDTGRQKKKQCIAIAASTVPAQYLLPELLAKFNGKNIRESSCGFGRWTAPRWWSRCQSTRQISALQEPFWEKKHCRYIPFYRDEMVIIAPNSGRYQAIDRTSGDISWICQEAMLMREEGSGTRKEAERQLAELGILPQQLNIMASIGNQETIKKSVIQGLGISILSNLAVREEVEDGKLLAFSVPSERSGRDINVVYNKNYQLSKSAKRFLRTVKEAYKVKE